MLPAATQNELTDGPYTQKSKATERPSVAFDFPERPSTSARMTATASSETLSANPIDGGNQAGIVWKWKPAGPPSAGFPAPEPSLAGGRRDHWHLGGRTCRLRGAPPHHRPDHAPGTTVRVHPHLSGRHHRRLRVGHCDHPCRTDRNLAATTRQDEHGIVWVVIPKDRPTPEPPAGVLEKLRLK